MEKSAFLSLLTKDGYTIEKYITSTNIIAHDGIGFRYKINKQNYLSGKKPSWIERNPFATNNIQIYLNINNIGLTFVGDCYKGMHSKLPFICKKHIDKGIQYRTLNNIIYGKRRCHYCTMESNQKRIDESIIIARCKELGLEYVGRDISKDYQSIVRFICPDHKDKGAINVYWYHFRNSSYGCPYCAGKNKTTEDFVREIRSKNSNVKILSDYKGYSEKVLCSCNICGNQWKTSVASLRRGTGCPKCTMSKGQRRISELLERNNIEYCLEYSMKDCLFINQLKFDFYIPKIKTAIEYDGVQHYMPIDFAGRGELWANEQFELNKKRDKAKNNYCLENGIRLIRIPYTEFDNIENVLAPVIQEYFL